MSFESLPFFETRHQALADQLDRFIADEIAPLTEYDETGTEANAREYVRRLAAGGFLREIGPAEIRTISLVRERLAYTSALADTMFAMQGLGSIPIALAGSDEQKNAWLPRIQSGAISALAMTESTAGSDPAAMKLKAERTRDGYVLRGEKTFISNAGLAEVFVVIARTADGNHDAHSAFIVPGDAVHLAARPIELIAPHPVGTLIFDGVEVPSGARVGEEGMGLRIAYAVLDLFRSTVGAAACGMARRALDEAVTYAQRREQFGKPIANFQGIQFMLAEMATELSAAHLLVAQGAAEADARRPNMKCLASMAKLYATDHAHAIIDRALQIHGGVGLLRGTPVERLYRDIRALRIYEGTSEIQKLVIARELLE
ncbi:MAG TPA: acyl-CoA dehydrogenase [Phycisphaerae bacterium]|jgi:acyl-CoA dehydrogenase